MSVEAMIEAARTWRGLDKLTVTVQLADRLCDEDVKLGIPRGRWRRVAQQLGTMVIVAARGYQDGQLLGTWEAPTEPDVDVDEEVETPGQAQHRFHTRWVIEEMKKVYADQQRLTTELVGVVVEIVRTFKPREPREQQPTPTEDEAAQTLRMLLGAAMSRGAPADADEAKRDVGDSESRTAGQGSPSEPDGDSA